MKEIDEGMSGIDIKFVLGKVDYYFIHIFEIFVYGLMALNMFHVISDEKVILGCSTFTIFFLSIVIKNIFVKAD